MGDEQQISNTDIFKLLETISKQNHEIKNDIKDIKDTLSHQTNQIDGLTEKVQHLEEENNILKQKNLNYEKKLKQNNVIIFGLPENKNQDLLETFENLIATKLNLKVDTTEISNIFRIGKEEDNKPRPIIVELVRTLTKQTIIKNTYKLKGTQIAITNDLTPEERAEQKILYSHYKAAKEKQLNVKIQKNKLIVNGESYTAKDLEKNEQQLSSLCNQQRQKINSAPNTPTRLPNQSTEETITKDQKIKNFTTQAIRNVTPTSSPGPSISTRSTTIKNKINQNSEKTTSPLKKGKKL